MPGKVKHIPENSICLLIKFQTLEEKSKLIQDEEFQKCKLIFNCNYCSGLNLLYF